MDSFLCPWSKPSNFSSNSNKLIRTPDADKGHYFLAQLTDSHWKSTMVMPTLHNQLCIVINVSFLKVKKPSDDSMSILPVLQCTGLWWIVDINFRQVRQRTVFVHVHVDERLIKCSKDLVHRMTALWRLEIFNSTGLVCSFIPYSLSFW